MAYRSLDKEQSKMSTASVAMLSVALGAVFGLAYSAYSPAGQLFAPAVTAVRPAIYTSVSSTPSTRLPAISEEIFQQFGVCVCGTKL